MTTEQIGQQPFTLAYREGSSDEIVIAEFESDPYDTKSIEAGEHWLDVGANIGLFSLHAAAQGAVVEAFEPDSANYEILQRNVGDLENVKCYPLAVTPEGSRVRLEQDDPQAFWHIKTVPDPHGSPSLELRRLITPGCRIKLDIEGAEHRLILGTPGKTWSRVERLVMEYHLDRLSLADFAKAKAHLMSAGLEVTHPQLTPERLEGYRALEQAFIVTARRVQPHPQAHQHRKPKHQHSKRPTGDTAQS